jgi:hypothetical protein
MKKTIRKSIWVAILGTAFGYIEAAVVVYLRQIFHPEGFTFPMIVFGISETAKSILLVEIGREAATIVLIISGCILAGENLRQRLAYFLIIFAVWDIFYYVFLWVILGWPGSIMDWDILFLIPVAWAGPVLAPVLVSVVMLLIGGMILYRDASGKAIKMTAWDMAGLAIASLIIITSFCIAGRFMQSADYASHFSWVMFGAGLTGATVISGRCVYKKEPVK